MSSKFEDAINDIKEAVHADSSDVPNFQDVEVALESDNDQPQNSNQSEGYSDYQAESEPEERNQPRPHPRKKTSNQRFAEMTYKNKVLESQLMQERNLAQSLLHENQTLARLAQDNNQAAIDSYEHSLRIKAAAAKHTLQQAIVEEDASTQSEAQELMSEVGAELALLKQRKSMPQESYNPLQNQAYSPQYMPPAVQPEASNPHYEDWVDSNPWFGRNPELTQEANAQANELKKLFEFNGIDHLVGTPEFFSTLDESMNAKYGVQSNGNATHQNSSSPQTYYPERRSPVAPINRQNNSYGNPNQRQGQNAPVSIHPIAQEVMSKLKVSLHGKPLNETDKLKMFGHYVRNPRPRQNVISGR